MDILKEINIHRRGIMRRLTQDIGHTSIIYSTYPSPIRKILISRPNGRLGNLLLLTPLLQDVIATFPEATIDLFVKGNAAPELFKNYKQVRQIITLPGKPFKQLFKYVSTWFRLRNKQYDLAINVDKNSSSGRLSTKFSRATHRIFGDTGDSFSLSYHDHMHMAKNPVYQFRDYLNKAGYKENQSAVAPLDIRLDAAEISAGKDTIENLTGNNKKTIALYTFATGDKCYTESWWNIIYERLITDYPSHNIIEVLPMHNVSGIGLKAPAFYSTDIREIASVIANVELFVTADCGIMHLSSAAHTPTVALFKVTDQSRYGPYNHCSVAINTNTHTMDACLRIINRLMMKTGTPCGIAS